MNNSRAIKNSFVGGFNKEDVYNYITSLSGAKDAEIKKLKDENAALLRRLETQPRPVPAAPASRPVNAAPPQPVAAPAFSFYTPSKETLVELKGKIEGFYGAFIKLQREVEVLSAQYETAGSGLAAMSEKVSSITDSLKKLEEQYLLLNAIIAKGAEREG